MGRGVGDAVGRAVVGDSDSDGVTLGKFSWVGALLGIVEEIGVGPPDGAVDGASVRCE